LGKFALPFDRQRCRWRIENGTDDPTCTMDEYGHPRRRGWINLQCNASVVDARAALVVARETAACDFELIVQASELCAPPPPLRNCNASSLAGATAQGTFLINGYNRFLDVTFNQAC
jgi:hypothetical protein